MEKTITLCNISPDVQDFLAMPDGIKKNIRYSRNFQGTQTTSANILVKEDGTIHFSHITYKISKGIKYFLKKHSQSGFTVDPKGKMKVWFGSKLVTIPYMNEVLQHLGREWVTHNYMQFITPSLMGKIIVGKITNPEDLCKAILKMYRAQASHNMLKELIVKGSLNKGSLLLGIKVAKNLDHYFEYMRDSGSSVFSHHTDLCNQALILERKVDFKWSPRRMNEEHKLWTKEIMDFEADSLSTQPLKWLDTLRPFTPDGFKLIDNEKDLYYEAKVMSHCVYANYWNSVKHGSYVVYSITDIDGINYTLGINCSSAGLHFNQLYGKHNSSAPEYLHNKVREWIKETNQKLPKLNPQRDEQYIPLPF